MRFGNSLKTSSWKLASLRQRGQMTVELAVCIPVILALVGVSLNVLGYLNACARFDRIAADAVRSQATSPGYGQEGSGPAAERVRMVIEEAFESNTGEGFDCQISVEASSAGLIDLGNTEGEASDGVSFSLLSRLERYECTLTYRPWPFSAIVFLQFFEMSHTRSYTVDPFRPGVVL